MLISEQDVQKIVAKLYAISGIDFNHYRINTLTRRIEARMVKLNVRNCSDYLDYLGSTDGEASGLIDTIAINVSSFFRNPIVFEILQQTIIPKIYAEKSAAEWSDVRVWSAGCATGEEAYSIAILLHKFCKKEKWASNATIFATDIDQTALEKAADGVYARAQFSETKLSVLDDYFQEEAGQYRVSPEITKLVQFSFDDLVSEKTQSPVESIFGSFDIILCRNVMIYFEKELQKIVYQKLISNLAPNGYLILGDSEGVPSEFQNSLVAIDSQNRIYKRMIG